MSHGGTVLQQESGQLEILPYKLMRQSRPPGGEDTALVAVMTLQAASDSLGE